MRLANLHIQVRNLTSTTFEFRILKNRGYLRNSYRWCGENPVILKRELIRYNYNNKTIIIYFIYSHVDLIDSIQCYMFS